MISRFSLKFALYSAISISLTVFVIASAKNGMIVGLKKSLFSAFGGAIFGGGLGEVLVIIFPDLQYSSVESNAEREKIDYVFPELADDEREG